MCIRDSIKFIASVACMGIHSIEENVDHGGESAHCGVLVNCAERCDVDTVLGLEGIKKCPLMDFGIHCDHNRQDSLYHLELYRSISFLSAITDGLNNGIDQEPVDASVLGGGLILWSIITVVGACTVEELIGKELLYTIDEPLHKARDPRLDAHFQYIKVLVSI